MRVMLFGTFDDLHPGHRYVLEQGQKRGDLYVVVGLDATVERIKGRPPLQTQDERKAAIEKLFPNATVLLGHPSDFFARIREVQPDLILLGYDQKLPPGMSEKDLPCPVERLDAFEPEVHKSSLRRNTR